jgi:hypothetical protein
LPPDRLFQAIEYQTLWIAKKNDYTGSQEVQKFALKFSFPEFKKACFLQEKVGQNDEAFIAHHACHPSAMRIDNRS